MLYELHLFFCVLELIVQVVQLYLAEFQILAVGVHKAAHHIHPAMGRKAQIPYAALLLLLQQVLHHAVLRIHVVIHINLAHVVEKIKVKVAHAAPSELLLEYFLYSAYVFPYISRELCGEVKAPPRVVSEYFAYHPFGIAAVIHPCGIIVIYSVFHGEVYHFPCFCLIDALFFAVYDRHTHRAKPQRRKLFSLEIPVYHGRPPYFRLKLKPRVYLDYTIIRI